MNKCPNKHLCPIYSDMQIYSSNSGPYPRILFVGLWLHAYGSSAWPRHLQSLWVLDLYLSFKPQIMAANYLRLDQIGQFQDAFMAFATSDGQVTRNVG